MTDPTPPPAAEAPVPARGRGLVIAGAILVIVYLIPAVALIAWFVSALATSAEAASLVFVFWLFGLLAFTPVWIVGIALLATGRSRQRGPVTGATAAWILAVGGMPAIAILLGIVFSLLNTGQDTLGGIALVALVVGVPLLTVLALLSGAWLTWGKPRAA
jgi:hypothetical protein